MAAPLLGSCCGCINLRNGSVISGLLAIILSIASIIIMFLTRVEFKTIVLDWLPSSVVKIILVINLVMTILISLLMIVGVYKRNHYCMYPWVALGIMIAFGLLVSVIYTAVVFFIDGFAVTGALWLVFGLISVVVLTYCWAVVYSFFVNLQNDNERGMYGKQPYRR